MTLTAVGGKPHNVRGFFGETLESMQWQVHSAESEKKHEVWERICSSAVL